MSEVKRKTEGVDEMLLESDTAVARAVRDVNETLAVHAAWTEERFEAVDDQLVSLARVQAMICDKIELQIAGVDSRLVGLGVSQTGMGQTLSRLEQSQAALLQDHVAVVQRAERLEQGQEALRQELGDAGRHRTRLVGSDG